MATPILSGLAALTVEEKARAKAAPAMNERSVLIFSPPWFRWREHTTMGTDRLMNVAFRQMNTPAPTENQKGPKNSKGPIHLLIEWKGASTHPGGAVLIRGIITLT